MAIFNLDNPYDVEKYDKAVRAAKEARAVVDMTRKKPRRTLRQNSYLHLLLGYFACEMGYTLDQVKLDIFKKECNRDIFEREEVNKRGYAITRYRSSRELSTQEMTVAIERFRNFSASVCGLYLPDANEEGALIHIEQQIEKNKEFL